MEQLSNFALNIHLSEWRNIRILAKFGEFSSMLMEKFHGMGSSCPEFLGEVASGQSYDERLLEMLSAVRVAAFRRICLFE
jgi:hypothetical protein